MKSALENNKLQPIIRKIIDQYSPEKIILFGSYAWRYNHRFDTIKTKVDRLTKLLKNR